MEVRNLENIAFDDLVECFLIAFENYYVTFPTDKEYFRQRWKSAKVNYRLSYGMFDQGKLVGFIIHAVDTRYGKLIAFNTGTGVIPSYRGQKITKAIYEFALKDLVQNGIEKTALEVITKNDRAIRVYKDVGFEKCRDYFCYSGQLHTDNSNPQSLIKKDITTIDWSTLPNQQFYSWDFQKETLVQADYQFYEVWDNSTLESYFIKDNNSDKIAQLDILSDSKSAWKNLFCAINQITETAKIINVDTSLEEKLKQINLVGLENILNQYEMEMGLGN